MADTHTAQEKSERRAIFALWSICGLGTAGIESLCARSGSLTALLPLTPDQWDALAEPGPLVAAHLREHRLANLSEAADRVWAQTRAAGIRVCFRDDPGYPPMLARPEVPHAPPLLFFLGPGASDRKAVAMVGSRNPGAGFSDRAADFAEEVARAGVVIVSGAAMGVDWGCHIGALRAGGETWAFLGSGLDQIDPAQRQLCADILAGGGTVFSEYPPGARANRQTFPRRNRLISGSAMVTVVLRARRDSGALHTARYAKKQGRDVYVLPADHFNELAFGGLDLLGDGAHLLWSARSLLERIGVIGSPTATTQVVDLSELSPVARQAYEAMARRPQIFEDVQRAVGVDAGALVSALSELELSGLVVQHPGKLYERI